MSAQPYQFRTERIQACLQGAAGGALEEPDLDPVWDGLVTDGSTSAYLLTADQIAATATTLARLPAYDPRYTDGHAETLARIGRHEGCEQALAVLAAQRDDILAALIRARDYCFNDLTLGEYGDLYVDADVLLTRLRPTLPGHGDYANPADLQPWCQDCNGGWFVHSEDCDYETRLDTFRQRRHHAVAAHLHCDAMAHALLDNMHACLRRVETVATRILAAAQPTGHGDTMVDPHRVLDVLTLADLDIDPNDPDPAVLAAAIWPTLVNESYCQPDGEHHDPHRACRDQIS